MSLQRYLVRSILCGGVISLALASCSDAQIPIEPSLISLSDNARDIKALQVRIDKLEKLNNYQVEQINGLSLALARTTKRVYALEHK